MLGSCLICIIEVGPLQHPCPWGEETCYRQMTLSSIRWSLVKLLLLMFICLDLVIISHQFYRLAGESSPMDMCPEKNRSSRIKGKRQLGKLLKFWLHNIAPGLRMGRTSCWRCCDGQRGVGACGCERALAPGQAELWACSHSVATRPLRAFFHDSKKWGEGEVPCFSWGIWLIRNVQEMTLVEESKGRFTIS